MSDRRRLNGPASGTIHPIFANKESVIAKPQRYRKPNELRKIYLKTGLVPAANGSAYLELEPPSNARSLVPTNSTIKLSCTVHGPRPLPRNASFSPNLQLNATIKFAPFATRQRRGYVRDNIERDLGSHLESAVKGVIIPDRWPKSSVDIVVTVLEGEEDCLWALEHGEEKGVNGVGLMNVLAGSITAATAALTDAGIDCLDLLTGGVAAIIPQGGADGIDVLDPSPSEHVEISSACVVGYLPSRDEVTEIWSKGSGSNGDNTPELERLIDGAVRAARGAQSVLVEAIKEQFQAQPHKADLSLPEKETTSMNDVEMKT